MGREKYKTFRLFYRNFYILYPCTLQPVPNIVNNPLLNKYTLLFLTTYVKLDLNLRQLNHPSKYDESHIKLFFCTFSHHVVSCIVIHLLPSSQIVVSHFHVHP